MASTAIATLLLIWAGVSDASAQGTAFTYQGKLNSDGTAAAGDYDFTFTLYSTITNGSPIATPVTNLALPVTNGLFTSTIDFGVGVFTGGSNWLEIGLRTNGPGTFIPLLPRQPLTPTPYAIFAANANTASNLSGTIPLSQVPGLLPALANANGAGLTNLTTLLNDPDVVNFVNSNHVSDLSAQFDYARMVSYLKSLDYWKYVKQGVAFQPRFNPTNGFSFTGQRVTYSNFVDSGWGFRLSGTNAAYIPLSAPITANTIIVVFRTAPGFVHDAFLAGLVNTNTQSAYWIHYNGQNNLIEPWESDGTNLPFSGNPYTAAPVAQMQPYWIAGYSYFEIGGAANQRKVLAVSSDGAGTRQMYQNSLMGKIGTTSPQFTFTSPVICTDPMNRLEIGQCTATNIGQSTFFPPFIGEISCVMVLGTTNQTVINACYTALRYLEVDEVERFFAGDSRTTPDIGTNNWPMFFEARHAAENCWHNIAQGATTALVFQSYPTSEVTLLPKDKVKEIDYYYAFGVNDNFRDGTSASNLISYITNGIAPYQKFGAHCFYLPHWTVYSGSTSVPFSPAAEARRLTVNQFFYDAIYGGGSMFEKIYPTDQLFNDQILNPANLFSTDGTHFNGPNGPVANTQIARLVGDSQIVSGYGVPNPAYGTIGPIDAYGNVWISATTNIPASAPGGPATGPISNAAIVNSFISGGTLSNAAIVNSTLMPTNFYFSTNGTVSGSKYGNFITGSPGAFRNLHIGDNFVISNTSDQYIILDIPDHSNAVPVYPALVNSYTNANIQVYPNAVLGYDINGPDHGNQVFFVGNDGSVGVTGWEGRQSNSGSFYLVNGINSWFWTAAESSLGVYMTFSSIGCCGNANQFSIYNNSLYDSLVVLPNSEVSVRGLTNMHGTSIPFDSTISANAGLITGLVTKTSSYNIGATDSTVLLNGVGLTATLPSAAGIKGQQYTIKLIAASTATVATANNQTIDGTTTYPLTARYRYVTVQSDGSQWWVIANN